MILLYTFKTALLIIYHVIAHAHKHNYTEVLYFWVTKRPFLNIVHQVKAPLWFTGLPSYFHKRLHTNE